MNGSHSIALSPSDTALAMSAFLTLHRVAEPHNAWLAPFGVDLAPAQSDPLGTLQRILFR